MFAARTGAELADALRTAALPLASAVVYHPYQVPLFIMKATRGLLLDSDGFVRIMEEGHT